MGKAPVAPKVSEVAHGGGPGGLPRPRARGQRGGKECEPCSLIHPSSGRLGGCSRLPGVASLRGPRVNENCGAAQGCGDQTRVSHF